MDEHLRFQFLFIIVVSSGSRAIPLKVTVIASTLTIGYFSCVTDFGLYLFFDVIHFFPLGHEIKLSCSSLFSGHSIRIS